MLAGEEAPVVRAERLDGASEMVGEASADGRSTLVFFLSTSCPVCKTLELRPTMIEELLPAMGCEKCKGTLVSLLYYRHWAENHKPQSEATEPSTRFL